MHKTTESITNIMVQPTCLLSVDLLPAGPHQHMARSKQHAHNCQHDYNRDV
jgi:hypothetical protein